MPQLDVAKFAILYRTRQSHTNGSSQGSLTLGKFGESDFVEGDLVTKSTRRSLRSVGFHNQLCHRKSRRQWGNKRKLTNFSSGCVVFDTGAGINQLANLHKIYPVRLGLIYIAMIDMALYNSDYAANEIDTAIDMMEKNVVAPPQFSAFLDYLHNAPGRVIVADNTGSRGLAEKYPQFLRNNISIVTPNKKAFFGYYDLWESIANAAKEGDYFVFHESLVGGGMPIISSHKEMVETGEKSSTFDQRMRDRKLEAEKQGKGLRYIGSADIASGKATVGLQMLDKSHPIANLEGSDNLISFYTKMYNQLPLTIRGAGAGGDVTAIGVTGDLLKMIKQQR